MTESKVVISVTGGNVNGIFTSDPNTKVYLVDYDNLESDPSDDCSQHLPVRRIEEFQSLVAKEIPFYSGITALSAQLKD